MKGLALGAVLMVFALAGVPASASALCSPGNSAGAGGACATNLSGLLPSGSESVPVFALTGQASVLIPVSNPNPLSFKAAFAGSRFGPTSVVASSGAPLSGMAGRPSFAGADGVGGFGNVGVFSGLVGDGGYWRPAGDGWYRLKRSWGSGTMGIWDPSSAPLDDTPEPFTLLLFGTGLLMIALLARRSGAAGNRP